MKRLGALAIIIFSLVAHAAHADAPRLEKVDTGGQPLKLSVPLGWQAHTEAPRHRDLSTIAGMSPECPGTDITVMIQLDQDMKTPADLLKEQYPGVKAKKLHGWDCVAAAVHTEVMCAGRVAGLAGIVGVYFATTPRLTSGLAIRGNSPPRSRLRFRGKERSRRSATGGATRPRTPRRPANSQRHRLA